MNLAWGPQRPVLCACLLLGCGLPVAPALAQADPGLYVMASYQLQHDSNLFRLPAGVDPRPLIGRASTSELVHVQSLGLGFDQRYSLQRVRAEVSLTHHRYQHFPIHDLLAKNYSLNWHWAYTPELFGRAYLEREESVNSFADAQSRVGDNSRLLKRQGLELRYGLDGTWQLQAALHQTRDTTNVDQFGEDAYRQTAFEAGLQRHLGPGNRIGARARHSNGRNLDRPLAQDDYRQDEWLLDLQWVLSGKTTASGNLSLLDRSHPGHAAMDFSGHNASLNLNWQATGKTAWSLSGSSAVGSYQTATSTHARNDRLSLTGTWQASSRTTVLGSLGQTHRRVLGTPAGALTDPRRDRTSDASLTLTWHARPTLSLQTRLQHSQRRSTQAGADFSSTQASLGLHARF